MGSLLKYNRIQDVLNVFVEELPARCNLHVSFKHAFILGLNSLKTLNILSKLGDKFIKYRFATKTSFKKYWN